MNRLKCEDCGTAFYSAAAKTFVEKGERCSVCGGLLRHDEPAGERRVTAGGKRRGRQPRR